MVLKLPPIDTKPKAPWDVVPVPLDPRHTAFDQVDRDHDGKISKDEYKTAAGYSRNTSQDMSHFEAVDLNHDGVLSEDEYRNNGRKPSESTVQQLLENPFTTIAHKLFGFFSQLFHRPEPTVPAEPGAGLQAALQYGKQHPGVVLPRENPYDPYNNEAYKHNGEITNELEAAFKKLDANHDGQASKEELIGGQTGEAAAAAAAVLQAADTDHDGQLSLEEFDRYEKDNNPDFALEDFKR